MNKLPRSQIGFATPILLLVILVILVIGGGGYTLYRNGILQEKTKQVTEKLPINKSPYAELESVLNKTSEAKTAYIDYKTKVISRVTIESQGVTKTLNNNVDGYLTGSTDGKIGKAELRISSAQDPATSVNVEIITIENGDVYVKGPATGNKWSKKTKAEQELEKNKQPTDASLYGFEFLSSIFSESKALFKTFKKEGVEKLPDQKIEGKDYSRFRVEISAPDYVAALKKDKDKAEKDIKDAEEILKDSTIKATFTVDRGTNYVTKLVVEAKNLTQIRTPEAEELGVSTKHDLEVTAELSRFDVPTGITAPDDSETLEGNAKTT